MTNAEKHKDAIIAQSTARTACIEGMRKWAEENEKEAK